MATPFDWSLHKKGIRDANRHKQKVIQAIKDNLQNIIAEEAIITSEGNRIIRVPIRSIKEFYFRFGDFKVVGTGNGSAQKGDLLWQKAKGQVQGSSNAGDMPGEDYYEAEISVDELADLVFEDLSLPNLKPKVVNETVSDKLKYMTVERKGPIQNLNRTRTIFENIKRNAISGKPRVGRIQVEDLRFTSWEHDCSKVSNAVIIAMRDISASMGEFEKYITRSFFFWMLKFLRTRYDNVKVAFLVHHSEAKEVDEEAFFKLGQAGGTKCSTVYKLALQLIENRYPPQAYNIYPFHFTDGENWPDDTEATVTYMSKLLEVSNVVGYGEIRRLPRLRPTPLTEAFETFKENKRLVHVTVSRKEEVWDALKVFFSKSGDMKDA